VKATKLTDPLHSQPLAVPKLFPSWHVVPAAEREVRDRADPAVLEMVATAAQQGDHRDLRRVRWIATTDAEELQTLVPFGCKILVNLAAVNNLRRINRFFRAANARLPERGLYVCCMETLAQRWERVFRKYPAPVALLFYLATFVLNRVFPKLPLTKQVYFWVTGGKNRVISEPEALGRLICCGFLIVETREIGGYLYIIARKVAVTAPAVSPSYGPLFRAPRVGEGGKQIRVFKLRTMYPYSEYLQEYVYQRNRMAEGGKFKDDFRITGWGRFCRRYWVDEIPMLLNWLKGDLKLVGVRPLSHHYASLYPEALRTRRQQTKPGLIPPFYADLPVTFEEIVASEERYLDSHDQQPVWTDVRYLCRALYNIFIRHARSA
jgi:lipopolysaccharide/colanic/teichoic acid biosynthesis glycosyltransferase